jgi:hypothetical protein
LLIFSDQTVAVEYVTFFNVIEAATPDLNAMEWPHPCPFYVPFITWVTLMGSANALMGGGLTIPQSVNTGKQEMDEQFK